MGPEHGETPASPTAVVSLPSTPAAPAANDGMEEYRRLQRRLLLATLLATALAVPLTVWLFGLSTAASLLIGALGGLLYLRLLSRSVSRLGGDQRSVGKVQLLVPLVLFLAAAKLPQLQILPTLVGFLLYKPALIAQALLDT
ncbi:MAG: ATP synthase [Cyanobium sp.]